jgi:hypothetical protein
MNTHTIVYLRDYPRAAAPSKPSRPAEPETPKDAARPETLAESPFTAPLCRPRGML